VTALNENGRSFHLLLMGEGTIRVRSLNPTASYREWAEHTAPQTHYVLYFKDLLPMEVKLPPLHVVDYSIPPLYDRDTSIVMAVAVNYRGHTVIEPARGQTLTIHDSPEGLHVSSSG
jgi:hypothetical protein